MELIMNYDTDENDEDVAFFLLYSVFYCLCAVLFIFTSMISLYVANIICNTIT